MDSSLLVLFVVVAIGSSLLLAMFVLPQRKLPEEKGKKSLYEERCFAHWQFAHGMIVAGGNLSIARISFYDGFFVVALGKLTKVLYSEVLSTHFKKSWLSKSITIQLSDGRSLVVRPKNFEKVQSVMEGINGDRSI